MTTTTWKGEAAMDLNARKWRSKPPVNKNMLPGNMYNEDIIYSPGDYLTIISPFKVAGKMIFLFHRWDMLAQRKVHIYIYM